MDMHELHPTSLASRGVTLAAMIIAAGLAVTPASGVCAISTAAVLLPSAALAQPMPDAADAALRDARQALDEQNYTRAIRLLIPLANQGRPEAQFLVGQRLGRSAGRPAGRQLVPAGRRPGTCRRRLPARLSLP
jgi:hypothetical protein